jgi:hypothetical protein
MLHTKQRKLFSGAFIIAFFTSLTARASDVMINAPFTEEEKESTLPPPSINLHLLDFSSDDGDVYEYNPPLIPLTPSDQDDWSSPFLDLNKLAHDQKTNE